MARLAIFTSEERRLFELPPLFNSVDRKRFFFLPESLLKETKHFDKPHNEVVKSDIHSTDTHGYTEGIFGTAYFLGLKML